MKYIDPKKWTYTTSQNQYGIEADGEDFMVQNGAKPWSIAETAPDTFRFEVRSGDRWAYDSTNKERSEIADQTLIANKTPIHVSYQFDLEPGAKNTAAWMALGQFHQNDYAGAPAYSPPFAIGLIGEKMAVTIWYTGSDGKAAYKYLFIDNADIQRGHFYNMDIKVTFDPSGAGSLVVTRDGQTLVNYAGPLGYTEHSSVYWKEGIYRASAAETEVAYYRNLSITTGAAAGSTVASANAVAAPAAVTAASTTAAPPSNTIVNADGSKQVTSTEGTDTAVRKYSAGGTLLSEAVAHKDGSRDTTNYAVTGQAYTVEHTTVDASGKLVAAERKTAAGATIYTMAATANAATTDTFDTTGKHLTQIKINKDGSKETTNFAVTGQIYTTEHTTVDASGKVVAIDRKTANNVMVYSTVVTAAGTTTDTYDTTGRHLTQIVSRTDGSRQSTNFAVTGQAYTTEVLNMDTSGKVIGIERRAGTTLVYQQVTAANGTTTTDRYDNLGVETSKSIVQTNKAHDEFIYKAGVVVEHDAYGAGGVASYIDQTQADGSHKITALAKGVTVASTAANDVIKSAGADVFTFTGNFGKDTITNFATGSGAGHDTIAIGSSAATSFQSLISQNMITMSGRDTVIALSPGNTITLSNVASSSLTAANFQFGAVA